MTSFAYNFVAIYIEILTSLDSNQLLSMEKVEHLLYTGLNI